MYGYSTSCEQRRYTVYKTPVHILLLTYDWLVCRHVAVIAVVVTNLTQYCSGDKMEKNETGGACSAYGGDRCMQGFDRET